MWLLHLLPDAFLEYTVNIILVVGCIASFLSFFVINRILRLWPGASAYYHIAQIVSLAILIAGVYFKGSANAEQAWRERVASAEAKVAAAEAKGDKVNIKIQTRVVTQIKEIVTEGKKVTEYIDREVVKYDTSCPVPKSVITALNAGATGKPIIGGDTKKELGLK